MVERAAASSGGLEFLRRAQDQYPFAAMVTHRSAGRSERGIAGNCELEIGQERDRPLTLQMTALFSATLFLSAALLFWSSR